MEEVMRDNMMGLYKRASIFLIALVWFIPVHLVSADDIAAFELGNDMVREENYAEALTAYARFVKDNPEHRLTPAAQWTMANIYMAINEDYGRAAMLYQAMIRENADTDWEIRSYDRLGSCFEEQQKWKEAAEVYKPAIQKLSALSESPENQVLIDRLKGRLLSSYQNMEDHESIILLYQKMLADNPAAASAPEDQFNLAQTYLDIDNTREAAENFTVVVERYPTTPYAQRVQSEHAELLASQYDYDWTHFDAFWSALRLSQTGHYDEARTQFNEVIEAKQNADMAYAAKFQQELIKYRENGDAATLMEKVGSSREEYPYGLGGVPADRLNSVLQNIVGAQESAASNPEDVGAYTRMAYGYYQTRAYYHGIEAYKKAIAIAPDNTGLYNMLGYCCLAVEEYDDAIATFQQVIDVDPDDPNAYDSMAEAYYTKGDTTMAVQLYQKSLTVDSSFTNPYYMLGRIYHELGQNEKAEKHLERYLELAPGGFQSQNAQNLLNELSQPAENSEP
jgi:tetratricopeptide (TPR) repeat protein